MVSQGTGSTDLGLHIKFNSDDTVRFGSFNDDLVTSASVSTNGSLSNGLVGYWSFDGKDVAGVTAFDRSGNGNNGTLKNGPTRAIGRIGQALSFDGVDDEVNTTSDFIGTATVTACAWIFPTAFTSFQYFIGNAKFALGISLNYNAVILTSDGGSSFATSAVPPDMNTWQHICGIRKSSGLATIYINGVKSGSEDQNSGTPASSVFNVAIGNFRDGGSDIFQGLIDDVRIYNRALSPDEIKRLYVIGK